MHLVEKLRVREWACQSQNAILLIMPLVKIKQTWSTCANMSKTTNLLLIYFHQIWYYSQHTQKYSTCSMLSSQFERWWYASQHWSNGMISCLTVGFNVLRVFCKNGCTHFQICRISSRSARSTILIFWPNYPRPHTRGLVHILYSSHI